MYSTIMVIIKYTVDYFGKHRRYLSTKNVLTQNTHYRIINSLIKNSE